MPQRRSSAAAAPPVMTWAKATPVLVVSAIFDAVRFMFQWFIFFGPALAAAYCTVQASGALETWTLGLFGVKTAGAFCATAAGVAGFYGATVIGSFGMVMAMAVGLLGWMTIGLLLAIFNGRIFKEDAMNFAWMIGSLAVAEIPFLGSIPSLTVAMWRLHHVQIKKDNARLAAYKKEQADIELQERQEQAGQLMQAQAMQQQAANDALYEQAEAANEAEYSEIPEDTRKAA